MVRIDEKNKTMLVQYEGISRIGNIFIDYENKCRITPFSRYCRNTDEVANSCINLAHHGEKHFMKDKNIVEFRFRKQKIVETWVNLKIFLSFLTVKVKNFVEN